MLANENALEARGINPQTELPDNVTLPGDATNVRFHSSKKTGGYIKKEVDEYIVNVIAPSLEWFKTALETRDQEVYRLGSDITNLEKQVLSIQGELDAANMSNVILSSKRDNEDDKEMASLMAQNSELRAKIEELQANPGSYDISEYESVIEAYKENETAYISQIEALNSHIDQLEQLLSAASTSDVTVDNSAELQAALDKCALMEKDLDDFQAYVDEIQVYTNTLEEKIKLLESSLEASSTGASSQIQEMTEKLNSAVREAQEANRKYMENTATIASINKQVLALNKELSEAKTEITKKTTEIASYSSQITALNAKIAEASASASYETAYAEAVQLQEATVAAHAEVVASLESNLNEAIERANEYYEHYTMLQSQLDALQAVNASAESEDSLIKDRNLELSAQLDAVQAELNETHNNYANLYEAYNALNESIPEGGIVSLEEHTSLKVSYDELSNQLTTANKELKILQQENEAQSQGLIAEGVTVENFNEMRNRIETLEHEKNEAELKYETLLKKGSAAAAPAQQGDEITYSEEEYMAVYTHASEAIEQYNDLVSVHEELREAYEGLLNTHEELRQAYEQVISSPQVAAPQAAPAPAAKPSSGRLPSAPAQTHVAAPQPERTKSKYVEKKLPDGITLEDLE